jgi:hypothetical protein
MRAAKVEAVKEVEESKRITNSQAHGLRPVRAVVRASTFRLSPDIVSLHRFDVKLRQIEIPFQF